ncbi:MAG: response regulator [Acidobacteriota bacterium]
MAEPEMPKVLVVDDEPNIVLSLEFLLRQEGYRVEVARDGDEALRRARAEPPDLVLLDVMLPDCSGFDVCRHLRDLQPAPRVILLTARGRSVERLRGLELGADRYVTKPFSTRDLMAVIRETLQSDRLEQDGLEQDGLEQDGLEQDSPKSDPS